MVRLSLAALLAVFMSVSASAEFSTAEKTEIKDQMAALKSAENAAYYAVQHALTSPADAPQVASFVQWQISAWQSHHYALLYLLDVQGDESASTADGVLAGPRADVVALALGRIQSPGYDFARGKLDLIAGASNALTTAKQLADSAIALRAGIDTALAYTEPRTDVNMATPGATRAKSAAIAPHGDYRAAGAIANSYIRNHGAVWNNIGTAMAVCPGWIPGSRGAAFTAGHMRIIGRTITLAQALLAGIEEDDNVVVGTGRSTKGNIDVMFAGGTTTRPREFMQVQFALEALAMWTHTGPLAADVNGRWTARGITYDLTIMGQVWEAAIKDAPAVCAAGNADAFRTAIANAQSAHSGQWGNLDNWIYSGALILRHFQVFPAPPPGGGGGFTCGPGTTEINGVCEADPCPTCPPEITCGEGTALVGTECVADILSCPVFHAQLDITEGGIIPRCVEVP